MLIQEIVNINSKDFLHSYSDSNRYIKQVETDSIYADAYDLVPCKFTYIETDIALPTTEEELITEEIVNE